MTKAQVHAEYSRLPFSGLPDAAGLYDPRFEPDACGVSFVVDIKGRKSRDIVETALGALCNLDHRGATGAEANVGDGAGILLQVPDRFLREVSGLDLPSAGSYAVGIAFLPAENEQATTDAATAVEKVMIDEGLRVLGWREVPYDASMIG